MPASPEHQPGQRFAKRYELREVLGIGGFGEVWLALDTASADQPVALKILQAGRLDDPRVRERFVREAELLTKLDHPSIPRALDWRCDPEFAFMALEYAEGQTLARRLLRLRAEPEPETLRPLIEVFRKTCAAVHYAHTSGVVHRDLKPPNILLVGEPGQEEVRILDFGLAKILDTDRSDETTKGRVLGSQNYLSPEQLTSGEVSNTADIFALGAILFELLTSRRTWLLGPDGQRLRLWEQSRQGPNEVVDVVARILRGPRPLVREYRPGFPEPIDGVILRALAVEPKERWPTAVELADGLSSAMAEWLEETRPAGFVGTSVPAGGAGSGAADEQWAIPTNSGQIEKALSESLAPGIEDALDPVVPTDLEAPPGEQSFSAHAARIIDTYAPFVRRRSPAPTTPLQGLLQRATSGALSVFFVIGVVSGVMRVWEAFTSPRDRTPPTRPVSAVRAVSAPPEDEASTNAEPASATPSLRPSNRERSPRAPAPAALIPPSDAAPVGAGNSKASPKLRKVDVAMIAARASLTGNRADPDRFMQAVTTLRTASQRDLSSKEAVVVEGALDVAVRSMELSRLERAYQLYLRFASPQASEGETIAPLD